MATAKRLTSRKETFGTIRAFGIEGTGSFGAGLSRFLQATGHTVIDVNHPNRQLRHQHGKSDPLDAESAARAVLSGQADTRPKTGTGTVEMIRHLKVARDTAVKSRTQAMVTLKTLIVNAPAALRQTLDSLRGKMALIRHLAALRPGPMTSTVASAKTALRAIARRWLILDAEIRVDDANLENLTAAQAPAMLKAPGIATGTAAEMLILVGDNPQRIRSEAAFAKLCGVCPIPASSGKSSRSRLNRGGNRQANATLYRSLSSACAITGRLSITFANAPPKVKQSAKSSAVSNASLPAKSSATYAGRDDPRTRHRNRLDVYRSINAMAESFFSTLEAELLSRRRFTSQAEARMACFSYIEGWYNPARLHSGLGYRSPMTYKAEREAALTKP